MGADHDRADALQPPGAAAAALLAHVGGRVRRFARKRAANLFDVLPSRAELGSRGLKIEVARRGHNSGPARVSSGRWQDRSCASSRGVRLAAKPGLTESVLSSIKGIWLPKSQQSAAFQRGRLALSYTSRTASTTASGRSKPIYSELFWTKICFASEDSDSHRD